MPNITAFLTIGRPDARNGFRPSYWAYLVDAKHPMWFITTTPAFPGELGFKRVWVTRRDTVVDDAMAMVAVVVEAIPAIVQRVDSATDEQVDCQIVDLSQLSSPDQSDLYRLNQSTRHRVHIVATVLFGSILMGQVQDLMRYQVSVQVATEHFSQDGSLAARFKRRGESAKNPERN